MPTLTTRRGAVALAAAGALLLATFAATPRADAATLYACVKKKGGTVHVFTKKPKCKRGESKLSWNTQGVAGNNGANGANGAAGKNGTNGTNGTNGNEGAPGQPQKAVKFNKTLAVPGFLESTFSPLFSLPEASVSVNLVCGNVFANVASLETFAPAGSRAASGVVVTNSESKPPEVTQTAVKDVAVTPAGESIMTLTTNTKEPFTNIGHFNASVTTPSAVVFIDAFVQAAPNPSACIARGLAFSIPS
jgi:hypothetical protein